jgi:hypothetical protein
LRVSNPVPQCPSSGTQPVLCWDYQHTPASSGNPGKCPNPPGPTDDAGIETRYNFQFVTPLAAMALPFGGGWGSNVQLTGEGVMPCLA